MLLAANTLNELESVSNGIVMWIIYFVNMYIQHNTIGDSVIRRGIIKSKGIVALGLVGHS